jgi:hypothetical protein
MKKLFTLLVVLCSATLFAQTSGITYQAVILNPEGQHIPGYNNERSPVVNRNICMRFTIYAGTTAEYQETQQTTTDEFGMVNLVIGTGSPAGGTAATFADIVWDGNPKNLQAEVNLTGICQNFTEISNQPLTAVPYALYAANSGTGGSQGEEGNLTLVNTTTEAAGTNCATGGVKLEFGVDLNRNGTLETEEIATGLTKYVCNGAAGPQGTAGTAGPAGPAGPQGVAGVAGAQGAQGIQGVPGPTGAAGAQGTAGNNGLSAYQVAVANGYVGTEQQWLTSIQGAAGTNGQSAYQVAVANGFSGTQTEWLASLVGAQGPQGPAASGSNSYKCPQLVTLSGPTETTNSERNFSFPLSNAGSPNQQKVFYVNGLNTKEALVRLSILPTTNIIRNATINFKITCYDVSMTPINFYSESIRNGVIMTFYNNFSETTGPSDAIYSGGSSEKLNSDFQFRNATDYGETFAYNYIDDGSTHYPAYLSNIKIYSQVSIYKIEIVMNFKPFLFNIGGGSICQGKLDVYNMSCN